MAYLANHDVVNRNGVLGPKPAPRHKGAFSNEPLPRPPSFDEADVSDKPAAVRSLERLSATEIGQITTKYRARLETLLAADEGVRDILDTLQASGLLDNTVVIFTSDNGFFAGEHRIPSARRGCTRRRSGCRC